MSPIILNTMMTICFVAGKSGGHLLPCITQANQLQKQNPNLSLYLFSSGSELDHKIVDKHTHIQHIIPTEIDNPPYEKPWILPWFGIKTLWYGIKSIQHLRHIQPDKVISFGGFVSVPVCLAAKLLGIPFEIYELNVEPGKATKFLSKFTSTIHTCFESTKNYFPDKKCMHFDYPIRFQKSDLIYDKQALLQQYNLSNDRYTLVILGGSQGSILLNQQIKNIIVAYPNLASKIQVIHQTGISDSFNYAEFYKQHDIPAHVFGYHEKLQDFYNLADLIICRAGAGTLFEIKFFNKKCITIPHQTSSTNHQIKNVLELQKEFPDLFTIIPQSECSSQTLMQAITKNID